MKAKRFLVAVLTSILSIGMVMPSFTMAMEVEEDAGLESNNGITPEDTEPSTNTDVEEEEREVAPAEIEFFGGSPNLITETRTIHFDIINLGLGSTVNAYVYIKNQATGMEYTVDFELGHGEIKSIDWDIPTCGVYTAYLYNNGQCVSNEWSGVLPHIIGDTRKANIVEPTCTEEGRYDVEYQCSTCSEWLILESDARMAELGHQLEEVAQVDATRNTAGHKAYWVCTRDGCGAAFEDADGTVPIEDLDAWLSEGGDGYIDPLTISFSVTAWWGGTTIWFSIKSEGTADPGTVRIKINGVTYSLPGDYHEATFGLPNRSRCRDYTLVVVEDGIDVTSGYLLEAADKHNVVTDESVEATCENNGLTEGSHCSVCGTIFEPQETIPATGHDYQIVDSKEATCTEDGYITYTCNNCEDTYTDVIEAKGHTVVIDEAIAPTCTRIGWTEGSHCSVCGETLVKQTVILWIGHDLQFVEGEEATCEDNGYLLYRCTRDGCGYTELYTLTAKGHDWDEGVITTPATCTTDGIKTYTCQNDSRHTKTETVEALGHNYEQTSVKAATCTEDGYIEYTCTRCEDSYKETIPATGHTLKTVPGTEPTYQYDGHRTYRYCEVCGYREDESGKEITDFDTWWTIGKGRIPSKKAKIERDVTYDGNDVTYHYWNSDVNDPKVNITLTLDTRYGKSKTVEGTDVTLTVHLKDCTDYVDVYATWAGGHDIYPDTYRAPHTIVVDEGYSATCEHTGLTEGRHCSACDKVLKAQTVIPITDHTYGEYVYDNNATCLTDGTKTATCSVCGATDTVIDTDHLAFGHTYDSGRVTSPATCTEEGILTYTCTNDCCTKETEGHTYTESIPARGHNFGDWVVTKKATCTEDGEETRSCKRPGCTETETRVIEALKHTAGTPVETITKEPTCTEAGTKVISLYCTECKRLLAQDTKTIPATGHTLVEVPMKDSTVYEAGYKAYYECEDGDLYAEDAEGTIVIEDIEAWKAEGGAGYIEKKLGVVKYEYSVSGLDVSFRVYNAGTGNVPFHVYVTTDSDKEVSLDSINGEDITFTVTLKDSTDVIYGFYSYTTSYGTRVGEIFILRDIVTSTVIPDIVNNTLNTPVTTTHEHIASKVVLENYIEATCTTTGSSEGVAYCSICNQEMSRRQIVIPRTEHVIDSVEYNYLPDTGVLFIYGHCTEEDGKVITAIKIDKDAEETEVFERVTDTIEDWTNQTTDTVNIEITKY